jgi:hypothetical protein
MVSRFIRNCWTVSLIVASVSWCVSAARAQQNLSAYSSAGTSGPIKALSKKAAKPTYGQGQGGDSIPGAPEPYGGQLYCPVTGQKLGMNQPAVPVQTTIGENKPGAVAALFGKKSTPGMVIYASGPACAELVRKAPDHYLAIVLDDRTQFSTVYTYTTAPAERPAPPGEQR